MSSLTNQIALITGAGTGIGRQTARQMAAEGAHVIVVGRREALLTEVAKEIADTGGRATVHACDLEDAEAAARLGAWAVSEFGRVDVLVNNAGHSSKVRSVRYVGQAEWNSVFDVNVNAVDRLTQAVLPAMIAQQRGTNIIDRRCIISRSSS